MTPKQIKSMRKKLGLTQASLAYKIGVTVTTVARWEIGMTLPRDKSVEKIRKLEKELAASDGEKESFFDACAELDEILADTNELQADAPNEKESME